MQLGWLGYLGRIAQSGLNKKIKKPGYQISFEELGCRKVGIMWKTFERWKKSIVFRTTYKNQRYIAAKRNKRRNPEDWSCTLGQLRRKPCAFQDEESGKRRQILSLMPKKSDARNISALDYSILRKATFYSSYILRLKRKSLTEKMVQKTQG